MAAAKKRREPDPEALLRDLKNDSGKQWTEMDRYRDFRAVFLGESTPEQGQRVLHEIAAWGHQWRTSMDPDPYQVHFNEGERSLLLKIVAAIENEPVPKPAQAVRKPNATSPR